jgi:hypothetical protein
MCAEAEQKKKKDPKEKKKRKLHMYQVFVCAAMEGTVASDGRKRFSALGAYRKSLSKEDLAKFESDYEPVLSALNDAPERYKDDIKTMVVNRNKELGIQRHEVFDGLEVLLLHLIFRVHLAGIDWWNRPVVPFSGPYTKSIMLLLLQQALVDLKRSASAVGSAVDHQILAKT